MSHLNKVIARVDATIEESVITHMNELLIELSDDAELSLKIVIPSSSACVPRLRIMASNIKKRRRHAMPTSRRVGLSCKG